MASSERSIKRPRHGYAIEGLLESSHEFAALMRTLDVANSSDRAEDPKPGSFSEYDEEDGTASLADHLRRVVQQRTLLQASGAVEMIDRQFDALLPQLQATAACLQSLVDKHSLPDVPGYCTGPPSISLARDIITYAHKLCYTTFAPPGYQAGVTDLRHFRPPMPQEWQLRASQLHQFAGVKMGGSKEQEITADVAGSVQGTVSAAPAVPDGEVLADLPPMPPGWKPGDPIPGAELKGGQASVSDPSKQKDQQPKAPAPPSANAAFDFILNPDWEAVEEDFSEDESD
ncbi:probable mediator of RNA polymerase II transcription subunit 4 at C-terminar half [Coccomyxa sp. Obi]|nr:probable mediator of RNA polymerase II transcription subunit 4 at C-terminar half [Coccomyxa sp. Obi]